MTYSYSKDGNKQIAKNFKVKEFRCKDGTDKIEIDMGLVNILQMIRDKFNSSLNINSAYRTESYNKKIGGSSTSKHCLGMACDFTVKGVPVDIVAMYVDTIFPNTLGIEVAENGSYIHIDTRTKKWRAWTKSGGSQYTTVSNLFPKK